MCVWTNLSWSSSEAPVLVLAALKEVRDPFGEVPPSAFLPVLLAKQLHRMEDPVDEPGPTGVQAGVPRGEAMKAAELDKREEPQSISTLPF